MKKEFSIHWKRSKQTRKQRKYRANAPPNIKRKIMSANLNKELKNKYGKRSFPVRKGDEVKIMRGAFKGKTGKISIVDVKNMRVAIEGMQRKKKDGSKVNVFFDSSKLQIQKLDLADNKRIKAINRKAPGKKSRENKKKEGKNA